MTAATLEDVRALLARFRHSDVRDLCVRAGDWSIFFARAGGAANPLVVAPAPVVDGTAVEAPHLGLFRATRRVGEWVAAGDEVAAVEVLDERRPVLVDRAGEVAALLAEDGAMVEYGTPLLLIG